MSLNDSSSLILIVGALAILAFVVHGLWFSGRSINRKLVMTSKEDQEIINSDAVGKVRIVRAQSSDTFKEGAPSLSPKVETYTPGKDIRLNSDPETKDVVHPNDTYELNVVSAEDRPYKGLDLEELCRELGLIRTDKDIFCVYENPQLKDRLIFRMCSLEKPYSFPDDMSTFTTHAIAVYMQLPPKGKARIYFKAMRCFASDYLIGRFGGTIRDNDSKLMTDEHLDRIEKLLKTYDEQEE